MSHFPVTVIGKDHDAILAPFDENIETAPRWEIVDDTVYRKILAEKDDNLLPATIRTQDIPELMRTHYGNDEDLVAEGGQLWQQTTYNENAKWDWYVVGGRWPQWFHVHPDWQDTDAVEYGATHPPALGGTPAPRLDRADRIQAKAVDWDSMMADGATEGAEIADKVEKALAGRDVPDPPSRTSASREDFQVWWQDPTVSAVAEAIGGFMIDPDLVIWLARTPRDEIMSAYAVGRITPYALASAEGWSAPGEMGWWGMSSDTQTERLTWSHRVAEILRNLPEDTWLTNVDCHI